MRKSVIISIVYPPTTPAFSHPSFPKEGNGDTTDWLIATKFEEEPSSFGKKEKGILSAIKVYYRQ